MKTSNGSINTAKENIGAKNKTDNDKKVSYFPKRGQTLELVCENLAFKGKGVCKVADTGFVVMCDRALPGERFIGRVTRKKDNYAEVLSFTFPLSEIQIEYCSLSNLILFHTLIEQI